MMQRSSTKPRLSAEMILEFAVLLVAAMLFLSSTTTASPSLSVRPIIDGRRLQSINNGKALRLTFKNTANQQPLSPSLFVLHTQDFQLFTVGQPSSDGMAILAETGNPQPLANAIQSKPGILAMTLSSEPVFPGNTSSVVMQLPAELPSDGLLFSFAGMLINTNDAYAGVCAFPISMQALQQYQQLVAQGESFDAGSEENNELCSSIPGPACPPDSGNVRSGNGEGVVATPHAGVKGVNVGKQLAAADLGVDGLPLDQRFTFSDPVSEVTLELIESPAAGMGAGAGATGAKPSVTPAKKSGKKAKQLRGKTNAMGTMVECPSAAAGQPTMMRITLTNTANQQPLSPSLFVLHTPQFQLFTVGQPSSDGMAILAETGNPEPLGKAIKTAPGVLSMTLSSEPVLPGNTTSLVMQLPAQLPSEGILFSYAGMLINTNDAYAGLNGLQVPLNAIQQNQQITAQGQSFDAGSEENNELCSSIPGPACPPDSGNVRSGNGEGVVATPHAGVKGVNVGKQLAAADLGVDGLPLDQRFTFSDPVSDLVLEFGSD